MAENPGSIIEFAKREGIEPREALPGFTVKLAAYRAALERENPGVTERAIPSLLSETESPEEIHD